MKWGETDTASFPIRVRVSESGEEAGEEEKRKGVVVVVVTWRWWRRNWSDLVGFILLGEMKEELSSWG